MESFVYIAHDLAGVERKGLKRASSLNEVYSWLRDHGLIPVEVKPAVSSLSKVRNQSFGRHGSNPAEIASFCWQLSTMLEGGVLITEAIETIAEDIEHLSFRHTLMSICERIKRGETFSSSVSEFPKVFSKLFCAMILAGETSGSLPTILTRLAEYFDSRDKFSKKVKSALAYPIFVVIFVVLILVVMMTVIIPKFRQIFDQMGGKLPAFTQLFIDSYDFIVGNIVYMMMFVFSAVVLFLAYNRTQHGHIKLCSLFLKVPLFGRISSQAFLATFCRTMSTLLSAGVSIIETFDILSEMTNNVVIKDAVISSKERMIEGSSISLGMAASGFFPKMVNRMVEVGEKSGSLPKVLDRASSYYEIKMDATITTMLSLLGPIVIVVVGGIVLVVVIALYLPIFSMSDVTS